MAILEGRRFALVVGVNKSAKSHYLPSLLHAEHDAHSMADLLRKPECNFTVLEPFLLGKDANTTAIKEAIADLIGKATYQDLLLFYFSGHAKCMKIGENREDVYFITHDFEETKVKVMSDHYFSMSWLWKTLYRQAEAKKVLFILDCCYAGKMVEAGKNPYEVDIHEIIDKQMKEVNTKKQQDRLRLILMATTDDTTALEKNGHGYMTNFLVKALQGDIKEVLDDEGRIDIANLTEYLKREIPAQRPTLWIEGNSEPCVLAHYPAKSARFSRETSKAREDILLSKLEEITSPDFFEKRTQIAHGPHTLPFDHLTPPDASLTDLDLATITSFFKRDLVRRQLDFRTDIPDQDQLANFDFLHASQPTYGALLCFGQKPQKWLPSSLTRCTHWRGNTRDSGWWNDQEIRGSLLQQFELCLDFLRKILRLSRFINQEGRTEQYEVPFTVLEEVLANALIHREYANRTEFVHVEVFDDRIEFSSPGDLPWPMTQALLGKENKSHPRNPQVARIFYLYDHVERVGSGIQRMQHFMKKSGLRLPKFEISKTKMLTVTLYRPQQVSVPIPINQANYPRRRYSLTGLFDIGVKRVCPSCFNEIYLGECRIVSGVSGKELRPRSQGIFARIRVEPLNGPGYTLELARRECTNDQCRYLLPPNIEKAPGIMLVVVGDTFAGKSHYIAALIYQLKKQGGLYSAGAASLRCLTPDVEDQYTKDYFEPLFIRQQVLAPTMPTSSPHAKPLIYSLAVTSSPKHLSAEFNLIIYDTAGEDFTHGDRIVNFARFVLNTSSFIFVADPLTMPPIFNTLPPHIQDLVRGKTAIERLNTIIEIYGRYHGYTEKSRLPELPIAVMVSKSDLFQNQPNSTTFKRNPSYGNGIDLRDINNVDREVRELLQTYQQSDLIAGTSRFKQVKFFATSATGEPPDASGRFAHVEPCRCLDPVLWILYQLGIVKASK